MIRAILEINELPNGVVTFSFAPQPRRATPSEARVSHFVDAALRCVMEYLAREPNVNYSEMADGLKDETIYDAILERARNLPPT